MPANPPLSPLKPSEESVTKRPIERFSSGAVRTEEDWLAVESPLEIMLHYGPLSHRKRMRLAILLRTPGQDEDLAAGWLYTEGIVARREDILQMTLTEAETWQRLEVQLHPGADFEPDRQQRPGFIHTGCGLCGDPSLQRLLMESPFDPEKANFVIAAQVLEQLPAQLRQFQDNFDCTGGIHAVGLFDQQGNLCLLREDVGRHNALDKVIGAAWQQGMLPLRSYIAVFSGRLGFELVQKSLQAGIPAVAAVGAPSSMAVEIAAKVGMLAVGFLREGRFNVYSGKEKLVI